MRIRCAADLFIFIIPRPVAYPLSNLYNWHIRIQRRKGYPVYYSLIPVPVYLILICLYMVARNRNDLKKTSFIPVSYTHLTLPTTPYV